MVLINAMQCFVPLQWSPETTDFFGFRAYWKVERVRYKGRITYQIKQHNNIFILPKESLLDTFTFTISNNYDNNNDNNNDYNNDNTNDNINDYNNDNNDDNNTQ